MHPSENEEQDSDAESSGSLEADGPWLSMKVPLMRKQLASLAFQQLKVQGR